jgi:hypothetical protein
MLAALQTLPRDAELLAFEPDAWPVTISAELAEERGRLTGADPGYDRQFRQI